MSLKLLIITLILALSMLIAISNLGRAESQEIEPNEFIFHRDLAISYVIGRDGTLTAIVGLDTFTVSIPQIANHFWVTIIKTVVNENITSIAYLNGQNIVTLTLNMTDNILHFDLEGRPVDANLLSFQFSENTRRLGENRTGLRLSSNREFYFDWTDIGLQTEFIEGSKSLRVDIRSAPTFKLDPRITITNPDFNTGDFTGWTGNSAGGCTQNVNATNPINGSHSHWIKSNATGGSGACSHSQSLGSSPTNLFVQFQFRVTQGDTIDGDFKEIVLIRRAGLPRMALRIEFNTTKNAIQFEGHFNTDAGLVFARNASFPNLEINTLYCVGMHYEIIGTPDSGTFELWINNTQHTSLTIDNDLAVNMQTIDSGQRSNPGTSSTYAWQNDDFYLDDSTRVNTCPSGLGPIGPPVPSPLVLSTLAPVGPNIMLLFIIIGLIALGQNNPWFVVGGWVSMSVAFGMSLSPAYVALDANNNPVTFIQAFPTDWSVWLFRFFIMMQFVYPLRILALMWERLNSLVDSLRNRLS